MSRVDDTASALPAELRLSAGIWTPMPGRLVARGGRHLVHRCVLIALAAMASLSAGSFAAYAQVGATPAGVQPAAVNVLIRSQYRRLTFPQDIQRVAVGDTEILSA